MAVDLEKIPTLSTIDYVGTPYHGLVTNGVLTLPNTDLYYPDYSVTHPWGPSHKIVSPSPPGARRTPAQQSEDTTAGREFRTYALRGEGMAASGAHVNGVVGALSHLEVLYFDPAGTAWILRYEWTGQGTKSLTLSFENKGRFGYIKPSGAPTVNTPVILTNVFTAIMPPPGDPAYNRSDMYPDSDQNDPGTGLYPGKYSQNDDGSESAFNINWGFSLDNYLNIMGSIDISGTGSLDASTFGDGISAVLNTSTLPHTYTGFIQVGSGSNGGTESDWDPATDIITGEPRTQTQSTGTEDSTKFWTFYHFIDHDGTTKLATKQDVISNFYSIEYGGIHTAYCGTDDPPPPTEESGTISHTDIESREITYKIGTTSFVHSRTLNKSKIFSGSEIIHTANCDPFARSASWVEEAVALQTYDDITAPWTYPQVIEPSAVVDVPLGCIVRQTASIGYDYTLWYQGQEVTLESPGVPPITQFSVAYDPVGDTLVVSRTDDIVYI